MRLRDERHDFHEHALILPEEFKAVQPQPAGERETDPVLREVQVGVGRVEGDAAPGEHMNESSHPVLRRQGPDRMEQEGMMGYDQIYLLRPGFEEDLVGDVE